MERQPTTVEVPKRRRRFFSFLFGRAALLIALALAAAVRS
jgi:hypothetical protein